MSWLPQRIALERHITFGTVLSTYGRFLCDLFIRNARSCFHPISRLSAPRNAFHHYSILGGWRWAKFRSTIILWKFLRSGPLFPFFFGRRSLQPVNRSSNSALLSFVHVHIVFSFYAASRLWIIRKPWRYSKRSILRKTALMSILYSTLPRTVH